MRFFVSIAFAIAILSAMPASAQLQGCYAPDTAKIAFDPGRGRHACESLGPSLYCGQQINSLGAIRDVVCRRCCEQGTIWNASLQQCCPSAAKRRDPLQIVAPDAWPPPMTR